jgi:hypothetical protein
MTKIILFILLFGSGTLGHSQSQEKVFAALIVKLARTTQWPTKSNSDFVIGVMAYSPLAEEIRLSAATLKKGNRKIQVREISSSEESHQCDIIFLPSFKSKELPKIIQTLSRKPVMVITNKSGLIQVGSTINMALINGKIQFEYNTEALNRIGLKMPTEMKNLGKAAP